jgi:putative ABC transport system substrate-binding protein
LLIAGGALLAPSPLLAQTNAPKVPRIGWLGHDLPTTGKRNFEPFRQRLRELNYVEGRDAIIDTVWAGGDHAKLPGLAKELVRRRVDIIVAEGRIGTRAARAATKAIPIVGGAMNDLSPAESAAGASRSGDNVTGVAVVSQDTAAQQLDVMLEIMPLARRVAVLWPGPRSDSITRQRKVLEANAPRYELTWHTARVRNDLRPVFEAIHIFRPEFLLLVTDGFYFSNRKELAGFAAAAKLPAIFPFREFVEAGGLISYGANIAQSYRSVADYVDKILKGAKPAELPVRMSKLELAVNIGAARAVGLMFPQAVLARADVIIP